ncbi:MAG: glycosyltransferase [Flavobacteriales bacterium]|nr:glycosyltransferase [Flavobacteriales bacterium]
MAAFKLSIITVTYNAEPLLEVTLNSIRAVKTPQIEYIVVDGHSKDGSLEVLKKHEDIIDQLVSEPDKGIYDAMNKAIKLAHGEYLLFINAGDEILAPPIQRIFREGISSDIIYGDALYVDEVRNDLGLRSTFTSRSLPQKLTLSSYKMGQRVSHQSFIVRKDIAPMFDLRYRISADYNWMLYCIKNAKSSTNLVEPISIFLHGGVSKQQIKKTLKERFEIMVLHFGWFDTLWIHLKVGLRALMFFGKNKRLD